MKTLLATILLLLGITAASAQSINNTPANAVAAVGTLTSGDLVCGAGSIAAQDCANVSGSYASLSKGLSAQIYNSVTSPTNGGLSFSGGTVPAYNSCYWNDTNSCVTQNARLRERVFVGNAVLMADTTTSASANTFLPGGNTGAGTGANWIPRDAQMLVMADNSTIALAGITQTLNTVSGHSPIGIVGYMLNNSATTGSGWAQYLEAQHNPGTPTGSTSYGTEIDCKNASTENDAGDPYGAGYGCQGIWLAGGGGPGYGPALVTSAATTTSSPVLTFTSVPATVVAGQSVYDATTTRSIGTVLSTTSTTVTLAVNAAFAVGSGDTLNITFPPNTGLVFTRNLNPWNVGINFLLNSVTADANGNSPAIVLPVNYGIKWFSAAGTPAGVITSTAAATIQLGGADQAAPVAQTLQPMNVVTGTSNTAGANFSINASKGTGSANSGSINFNIAGGGTAGSLQNALSTVLSLNSGVFAVLVGSTTVSSVNNGALFPGLQVNSIAAVQSTLSYHNVGGGGAFYLGLSKTNTIGGQSAVTTGDNLGNIYGTGSDGTHFQNSSAIILNVDAAVSTGIVPGRMIFQTANSSGALTEGFRVDSTQQVRMAATGATKVYTVATLPASPGAGAFAAVSDAVACTFLATLTGGSSTYCPVNYNGTAWVGG
jgi:hypothetical protein